VNAFQFGKMVKQAIDAEAPLPPKLQGLGDNPVNTDNVIGAHMRQKFYNPAGTQSNADFLRSRPAADRMMPYGEHRILGQDPDYLDNPNLGKAPLPAGDTNYDHPQENALTNAFNGPEGYKHFNQPNVAPAQTPYPIRGAGRMGSIPSLTPRDSGLRSLAR